MHAVGHAPFLVDLSPFLAPALTRLASLQVGWDRGAASAAKVEELIWRGAQPHCTDAQGLTAEQVF